MFFNQIVFQKLIIQNVNQFKKKKKIDHGIYDDISICPSKDKNESKRLFTISFKILKHFGEFNQFKMGLKSINEKFVHTDN